MKKRKTLPQLPKPKFAMTGLAVGASVGLVGGFVAELVWRRSLIVMQAGGIVGMTVGAVFETVRFWWNKRRYRNKFTTQSARSA
jgi:hypothetical protein